MSHGLPVISHTAPSMGQLEQIDDAGEVVEGYEDYAEVMKKMMYNKTIMLIVRLIQIKDTMMFIN